jgi:hypothetical protein
MIDEQKGKKGNHQKRNALQDNGTEIGSSNALDSADRKLSRDRNPFHRANIVRQLEKRREENPGFPEASCRKSMMTAIYTDIELVSKQKRLAYQKGFQRHIKHGKVECKLEDKSSALLLTISLFLSRDEYVQLQKHFLKRLISR